MHLKGIDIITIINRNKVFVIVSFILSITLYDYNTYVYISGYDIYGELDWFCYIVYDLQRFFAGCVGSALMLFVVWNVYQKNLFNRIIAKIGKESIGIYILSSKIISGLCYALFTDEEVNYIYDMILTVVIIGICHAGVYVLRKIHLTNKFFLGGF